jgi:hypothetical protein
MQCSEDDSEQEALMTTDNYVDNLESAVCYALSTTHAIAVCPFHPDVTIRVGDDAAETHAFIRAKRIIRSDGTTWKRESLMGEMAHQLADAADGECPQCVHERDLHAWGKCSKIYAPR